MTWKAQHAGDAAPPESPPNTGNAQETLEHVLFECRCPEIVTLRAEYANTFSAPTTNEWLESPHSAKFVYVALRVIEDRKKVAAGAAAAFTPVPKPIPKPPGKASGPVSTSSFQILRRTVQTSLKFGSKDNKT